MASGRRFSDMLSNITSLIPRMYGGRLEWSEHEYDVLTRALVATEFFQGADIKTQEELLRTTQLVYSCQAGKMVPRLREPRQLYGLNAHEFGPQQVARWPSDIQVAVERIKHIEYEPPVPEPFYKPTGREPTPMAQSHEVGGRTVYEYEPNIGSFFMRSRVNGSRGSCVQAIPESDSDKTLIFESRFESGNLGRVVQVGEYEYELWLRRDLYTTKHMQWFYFRVSNTQPNVKYRFTIVNLIKPDSLYNQGMKPLMYSEKNAAEKKIGWTRHGEDIKYYRNNIKYTSGKQERFYYSLTWTCQLPHKGDDVYYTHCYPYSYSDLQDYLGDIVTDPVKSKICKQRVLCRTLAGNMVYLLTITSPTKNTRDNERRKAVVITARIHPGESNSSWMMKGFLDYLVGNSADAKLLRDNFIFKIVPMLNPDGVIVGNYRCSLAGRDLNRSYKTMLKDSFPPVWHTKVMIKKLTEEREVVVYVDLHGHSRKQNVFIYGCENRGTPSRRLRERIFPVMLGKNAPTKFSYESCKFKIQKNKEGTGRVVMWNMGIMNSYTMEATFCGSSLGDKKGLHFSVRDFEAMGYHFCDTLLDYCDPDNSKAINILMTLEDRLKNEILQRLRLHEDSDVKDINDINLDLYYTSGMESSDGGSDSSVSDGLPVHLQYMADKFPQKKKRLRSKKDRDKNKTQLTKDPPKKSHVIPVSTPIRYSSAKRPRSKEERTAFVVGVPVYTLERMDTRIKKQMDPSYLAGLTDVYLQNGKLPPDVDKEIPHFRYTAGPLGDRGSTCPIHDPTYTVQNGNSHLQQHRYPDTLDETPPYQRGYRNSSSGDTSNGVISSTVSRQTNQDMEYLHKPLKQHPRPFEESQLQERLMECVNRGRTRQSVPRTTSVSSYSSRQQMSSRQSSAPHGPNITRSGSDGTAEIAAAMAGKLETRRSPVTRATESSSKNMYWSQSFTYGSRQTSQSSAKKSLRAKVPQSTSEIFHAPEATPITMQGPIPQSPPSGSSSVSSGVQDPCPTIIPTSPSVELDNTMKSFNEIRQSLMDPTKRKKLSPTTGQFVDHFVKKTMAEVEDITAEIDKKSEQDNKASAALPMPSTPRSSTRFQLQPKGARTKHGGYLAGHVMETSSLTTYLSNGRTHKSSLGLPSSYRPTSSRGAPSSYGEASGGQIDPEFTPIINNARTLSVQLQGTNLYQTTETRRYTKEQIEQGLHQGYARMDEGGSWTSSSDDKDRALPRRPSTEPASTGPVTRSNNTELEVSKPQSSVGCGPTKISLMISRGHQEQHSGQFHAHSLTRPVNRPPLLRNMPKRL